jgi:translation initiation factor IF-1
VPSPDAINVEGVIVDVAGRGLFRAELKNGHRILAYGTRRDREKLAVLKPGDRVNLDMSPFDMSKGRIVI